MLIFFICVWYGKKQLLLLEIQSRRPILIKQIVLNYILVTYMLTDFWKWLICTGNYLGLPSLSMLSSVTNDLFSFFCWMFHHFFFGHIFLFAAGGFPVCHHATPLSHWESFQGAKPQISHWRTWSFYKGIPLGFCAWTRSTVLAFHANFCHRLYNFQCM